MRQDINVDDLQVSEAYQRFLNRSFAKRIAEAWDEVLFGSLLVGCREDASLWVVDGQTRLAAARLREMATVPCDVFQSRGSKHEAQVFAKLNTQRRKLRYKDVFRARIHEGDPDALNIQATVRECGFEIAQITRSTWPRLAPTVTLENVWALGTLPETLDVIKHCWPLDDAALVSGVIHALGYFCTHDHDKDRLITKLQKVLPQLDLKIREQTVSGYLRHVVGARIVADMYNVGLRTKRVQLT